ncbi:17.6 kDa class I heat shock protein-like [Typha latifolia]|uniref:17.6 kDa class I heat shock protein-like n=1 Tax=Typha latifolia TaxID=4733 RepID=UPI003C2FB574
MSSLIPWIGGRGVFDPFTADLWDPFSGTSGVWNTGRSTGSDDTTAIARTNVDWCETEKAHIITADLPGLKKEEVKVEVEDGNVLRISGERTKEEEEKGDTWHRMERRRGKFTRRFRLPDNAKMDEIKCTMENGVLNVVIPKEEAQPSRNVRAIDIA